MKLSLAVAYLLGTTVIFLHGLGDPERRCAECGTGPAFTAVCDGSGCPQSHHHHGTGLPSHEPATCGICKIHSPASASAPAHLVFASEAHSTGTASPRAALPRSSTFACPLARGPPIQG